MANSPPCHATTRRIRARRLAVAVALLSAVVMLVLFFRPLAGFVFSRLPLGARDYVVYLLPAQQYTPQYAVVIASPARLRLAGPGIQQIAVSAPDQSAAERIADTVLQANPDILEMYVERINRFEYRQTETGLTTNVLEIVNAKNRLATSTFFTVIALTATPGVFGLAVTQARDHPRTTDSRAPKMITLYRLDENGARQPLGAKNRSRFWVEGVSYVRPAHAARPYYSAPFVLSDLRRLSGFGE